MENFAPIWESDTRYREITDGRILLVKGAEVYELDEVGRLIWQMCDGTHRIEDFISSIKEAYDVPVDTAKADCLAFLESLREAQLVKW